MTNRSPPLTKDDFQNVRDQPLKHASRSIFNFQLVTEAEVQEAGLDAPSKSSSVDNITAAMLKLALPELIRPLADLCNARLINTTFPSAWKKACIMPLKKNETNKLTVRHTLHCTAPSTAVVDKGGSVFEWLRAASGVPQRSVLGPLLFAVHINDLPNVLKFSKRMIFADDTQIYCHCSPGGLEQALSNVQADAHAISDWAAIN
ncbi:hypothetical protein TSAR_003408 [Trichomalopsis sarcophagae]|uniref:Reverse transcriptase domain-containing protein n=1 Tax=Trichomalopsis sarcophagae TaxID=543379 RepID=A0A232FI59_9HYME|nr:hypothetical protein TSAR_003408 [Trichomalopsis sarcophagae]